MPRRAAGLTARQVQTAKTPGMFADGGGLYLQVAPSGGKTWIFRFQLRGRRRDMGLGSATVFSLAEARQKAADAKRLVANGIDPIDQRASQAAAEALASAKAMHLPRVRSRLHRIDARRMEECEARCAVGRDARNLRLPRDGQPSGGRRRHRARAESA